MKIKREVKTKDSLPKFSQRLTDVPTNTGLPTPEEIQDELLHYCEVLLGNEPPDFALASPYLDLCEIASAYYARACDLEIRIYWEEQQNHVPRGHPYYRLRTGQIRTFMDMSKRMAELGSRRLSQENLLHEQRYDAGGDLSPHVSTDDPWK